MTTQTVVRDAVDALTALKRALTSSSGYDIDYLPREPVVKAIEALTALSLALEEKRLSVMEVKGLVLNIMDEMKGLLDEASTQKLLGAQADELSTPFRSVHRRISQKDLKSVESRLFG